MNFRQSKLSLPLPLILLLAMIGADIAHAQKPERTSGLRSFEPAEELVYEAEYSRSLLRKINAADFRFTAARVPLLQNPKGDTANTNEPGPQYTLQFTAEARSKGFLSKLFKFHFLEVSTVEPDSFSVQNTKRLDEQGKRVRTSEAVYDRANGKVVWTERDPNNPSREPRIASSLFSGQLQDVLSAIYYLRTRQLEIGKTFELSISDSGRVYQVPIRVVEKKRMKTIFGRVNVLRVDPELFGPRGMIASNGKFSIWLTDDNRHIPVRARIKNEYGTFDIKLKKLVQDPAHQVPLTRQG